MMAAQAIVEGLVPLEQEENTVRHHKSLSKRVDVRSDEPCEDLAYLAEFGPRIGKHPIQSDIARHSGIVPACRARGARSCLFEIRLQRGDFKTP